MQTPLRDAPRLLRRVVDVARRFAERSQSRGPAARRALLIVALLLFGAATAIAIRHLPPIHAAENAPMLFFLAALLSAANMFVRGAEFTLSARLMGRRVALGTATRVAVLSSAANVLPIPGATVVKVQSLRRIGVGYGAGVSVTLAISFVWVGVSAVVAGALVLTTYDRNGLGIGLTVAGVALLAGAVVLARTQPLRLSLGGAYARMIVLELIGVGMSSARVLCIIAALGFKASWTAGAILSSAGVVATAAGLFPGGVGLRELLSAGVAPAVGLAAAVGTIISAIDRVLNLVVLALAAAVVLVADHRFPALNELPATDGEDRSVPVLPPR